MDFIEFASIDGSVKTRFQVDDEFILDAGMKIVNSSPMIKATSEVDLLSEFMKRVLAQPKIADTERKILVCVSKLLIVLHYVSLLNVYFIDRLYFLVGGQLNGLL